MSEWINVKDKLPQYEGTYLTINSRGQGVNIIDGKGMMLRIFHVKRQIFSSIIGNGYVTHWMPLPEPPESDD